jgi:hypothetical protein
MVWAVSLLTTELISRSLTPAIQDSGIQRLVGFGNPVRPLAHPVPYLHNSIARLYLNIFRGEPAIAEFD